MGEVTILELEGSIADGDAALDIALPDSSIIHSVSIFPIGASTPNTAVSGLLYSGSALVGVIVPLQEASSDTTYPHAVVEYPHLPLPKDRSYLLKMQVYNLTGASVIWRMVAIVEVIQ